MFKIHNSFTNFKTTVHQFTIHFIIGEITWINKHRVHSVTKVFFVLMLAWTVHALRTMQQNDVM